MSQSNRQLAAIMFTDIVGYTALMGSDESKALSVLRSNRSIHKRLIKEYGGKWLKEMGDGTLAQFKTISDAVYCAGELIRSCLDEDIELRIGIHFGEITEEEGDIFGDGVNVASRLEPLAKPGQILVSGVIHRNVKNKQGIQSTFIEEKQLKNVDEPIKVYQIEIDHLTSEDTKTDRFPPRLKKVTYGILTLIILLLIISFFFNAFQEDDPSTFKEASIGKSIAVLPFKDMSPEQDQEYLGDGLAEEIINRLTKIKDLKVIGRTSSFSFKSKDSDLISIGEKLGVETILEGSVQKSGNRLRITAQLINAKDGSHVWSERFDRNFTDIFDLQDKLASLVLSKLKGDPKGDVSAIITSPQNTDPEAYEFWLKGDYFHRDVIDYDKESVMQNLQLAEKMFLSALDLQENYALAHAGLADLYNTYVNGNIFYEFDSIKTEKYRVLQREHIRKAYQYDPDNDYVNLAKGWVDLLYDEIDSAYQDFVRAIVLNPNDESNYEGLAYFLMSRGLYHEASVLYAKAKSINPIDMNILFQSSLVYSYLGKWEESISDAKDILFIDSMHLGAYYRIFTSLVLLHKIDEAEEILDHYKSKDKFGIDFSWHDGLIYASRKDTAKALAIRDNVSWYYSKLGMRDEYLNTFLQEYNNAKQNNSGSHNYLWLINRTTYDWIKDDPRIKEIVSSEKQVYDSLHAKYGNLDFVNL